MITDLAEVTEGRLCWPETQPRSARRVRASFRAESGKAESQIRDELTRWRIRDYVVSRNRQRIFAGDPAAALWWLDPKRKELRVLACDKWDKLGDNLRAIALTLEAMRALERWGAYTAEQAADGARLALPPPSAPNGPPWWKVLDVDRAWPLPAIEGMYRAKAKTGGDLAALNLAIEAARKEKAAP